MERNQLDEGHAQTGDGRGRDLSGHGKKPTGRGARTPWRWQREGLVRTRKETDRARGTHSLETVEGGGCQDTERDPASKGYSRSEDSRGSDLSGHGNEPTDRGILTNWRRRMGGLVRIRKKPTEPGPLTYWRRQREGLVRTRKETNRARDTHFLETAEGGAGQDMERNGPSKGHSPTGDGRGRDLSRHRKKLTKRGAPTNWRRQREGLVRT